ncbi:E3 ubiquitin-protein ligase NEDD4-like isoform X2 [Rhopilema esculentum]|uniref:E3 ubiquitin-protein ligase NEDD4-like isoform X2 n=1 Tax=Rhopilema esculentum TaxID=499914 RepID=UPI0031D197F0
MASGIGTNVTIHGLPASSYGQDSNIALLKINVIAGLNLAKKDIFGLSDPYCIVKLYEENRDDVIDQSQTKIQKKTLNPQWNATMYYRVKKSSSRLLFEIYDENRLTRDDFLGEVDLPLTDIPTESEGLEIPFKEYLLQRRSRRSHVRGHLRLRLAYIPDPAESQPTSDDEEGFIRVASSTRERVEEPGWETVNASDAPVSDTPAFARTLSTSENDVPLPPNWEERQDANGRTFYINHTTRDTTWERPRSARNESSEQQRELARRLERNFSIRRHISVESDMQARFTTDNNSDVTVRHISVNQVQDHERLNRIPSPLPPGWEERRDDEGRTFYIDHNSRLTTWVRPRASSFQPVADQTERISVTSGSSDEDPPESPEGDQEQREPQFNQERIHPDVPSTAEISLPPGWAMQLTPNNRVFFIDHNNRTTTWIDPRINYQAAVKDLGPLPPGWEERIHQDGRVFFIDHNTQSTQWEDPRIQKIAAKKAQAVPYSRDYKRKYDFFRSRLRKPDHVPNKYEIRIRRNSILEDSYRGVFVTVKNTDLLKTKLWIVFDGEVGLDYGGVSREWFYLLSKEIFNPYYGLFEYSATDNYTLQINPYSGLCNDEHLSYFKFIGRVAGMAVYHGKLLDVFFIRPFYKMMLGKKIALADMESVDSEYHNSLKWLQDNDPEDLDLRFQVEEEAFGKITSRELKRDGAEIKVTNDNKKEYIDLVIKWRFVDRINEQMDQFKEGFNEIIPHDLLRIFDERELEYLLCGLGEIDEEDWKKHTNYRGGYHEKHFAIQWFWKAVGTFDNEMKARLLQFVTGTSRVPMNGFTELYGSNGPQKFTIERWGDTHSLPRAHTCFNRLDLPPYTSYHELREKLRLAVENTEGFEGVD